MRLASERTTGRSLDPRHGGGHDIFGIASYLAENFSKADLYTGSHDPQNEKSSVPSDYATPGPQHWTSIMIL